MQRGLGGFPHERLHQESSGNNVDALLNRKSTAISKSGSAGKELSAIGSFKLLETGIY